MHLPHLILSRCVRMHFALFLHAGNNYQQIQEVKQNANI